jgi:ribonuclease R
MKPIKGRLTLKGRFGFVSPIGSTSITNDLYIDGGDIGPAMDGDVVLVVPVESRRGPAGRIERVIERKTARVVGTLDVRGKQILLVTEQATDPVRVEIDFERFPRASLASGLRAVAEVTDFPTPYSPAKGRLERILGEAGDPAVELEASRLACHVAHEFPAAVLAEVAALPTSVRPEDVAGRMDFRKKGVFTIDPTDARDFDDAISIEPHPHGGHEVGIHIADVSHYVRQGSPVDLEAYERATSTYLPGEVVPMLPEKLSNGICSLVEGEERLTVSIVVHFNADGDPVAYKHGRSVIRSKRRFTYDDVDVILESGSGDFAAELKLIERIARQINVRRMERGAIDLEIPEDKPVLDLNGKVIAIRRIERTWSHRLIEELMILANEHAARSMPGKGIYRIHEPPAPEKIAQLREVALALGRPVRGGIMKILSAFRDTPAQRVIETLALRSMQEAKYCERNVGHFGLASAAYSHFTSPIRRYPDLIAHRLILGEEVPGNLAEEAVHTSRREREAMEAERDAVRIKMLEFAATRLGEAFDGVIDHITRDGLFVTLDLGPRGLVPVAELGKDFFRFDRRSYSMVGARTHRRFRLGDPMRVVIAAVDIADRQLYLVPERPGASKVDVRKLMTSPPAPAPRRKGKGHKKAFVKKRGFRQKKSKTRGKRR